MNYYNQPFHPIDTTVADHIYKKEIDEIRFNQVRLKYPIGTKIKVKEESLQKDREEGCTEKEVAAMSVDHVITDLYQGDDGTIYFCAQGNLNDPRAEGYVLFVEDLRVLEDGTLEEFELI